MRFLSKYYMRHLRVQHTFLMHTISIIYWYLEKIIQILLLLIFNYDWRNRPRSFAFLWPNKKVIGMAYYWCPVLSDTLIALIQYNKCSHPKIESESSVLFLFIRSSGSFFIVQLLFTYLHTYIYVHTCLLAYLHVCA